MKITEEELGVLTNLAEECAEVQQMVSKIIRFGWDSYHPDDPMKTTTRKHLGFEVGNLIHMIGMAKLDQQDIINGTAAKGTSLKKYGLIHGVKTNDPNIEAAYEEAGIYIRQGALDDTMMEDIAHDHQITVGTLKARLEW